ncbi:antibiotic biosynthesis monooxygenase [Actinomadura sp. BRA 177]|nr:antibiotic biosynthesis monooxygenase [Actinomadura sp. BRA 177]
MTQDATSNPRHRFALAVVNREHNRLIGSIELRVTSTSQPGFVSLQMHKGTADSRLLMNVAVWESTEALATAFGRPEFQRMAAESPDDIVSYPHIFERIDV